MHWGRRSMQKTEHTGAREHAALMRSAQAVAALGAAVCVLFFCASSRGVQAEVPPYSAADSKAAIGAFVAEHAALADAIGLNAYFPEESVSVGAFSDRGDEAYRAFLEDAARPWTFGEYLRDAFRTLFGIS